MKNLKKTLCIGGAIALATALSGCSEPDIEPIFGTNSNFQPYSSSSTQFYDTELQFNYELLDYFYLYAHKNQGLSNREELGSFDEYYNPANILPSTTSYCVENGNFNRVCNMYEHMSDPFTRYFDPAYANQILQLLTESEETVGIGAYIEEVNTSDTTVAFVVSQVFENGPGYNSGLKDGDTILTINGITPEDIDDLDALLSGRKSDIKDIDVKRGENIVSLRIALGEFNTPTVLLTFKDSIPVIRITEFTATTINEDGSYGEFVQVLNKIKDKYKAAIIDLRDNPGGDVDHCNNMSAELLSKGDTIIIDLETNIDSSGRGSSTRYFQKIDTTTYIAEKDGIGKDLYYVFLADSGSASCAEVMLSAVTVNKKSPVVGLTSYGKGIGQYVMETYTSGLALVTGLRSMDKNGDVYHKVGIVPDFISGDEDEQMAKAIEWAKERTKERRTTGFYGDKSTGHFAKEKPASGLATPRNKKDLLKQMNGAYKFKKR